MTLENLATQLESLPIWAILALTTWTLIWKGLALWKSAKLSKPIWFIVLLVVNTLGILEILYIFLFSEMNSSKKKKIKSNKKKTKSSKKK